MDFKKLGLYEVLKKIRLVNFRLQLPKRLQLHLMFHISLLKPATELTSLATDKEIQPENDLDVYKVKKLLDIKITNSG